jgi:hypothetical protein
MDKYEPVASEILGGVIPHVYFKNMKLSVTHRSPDAFIFCTSYSYSEYLLKRWNKEEEEADSCYEIQDPRGFFRAVSEVIADSALFRGAANVLYVEDELDYLAREAKASPALTKNRERYGWQLENRAFWTARGPCGSLKPWIIEAPNAREYCRRFAFLENGDVKYET